MRQRRRCLTRKRWNIFAFDEIHGFEHGDVKGRQFLARRGCSDDAVMRTASRAILYRVAARRGQRQQKHNQHTPMFAAISEPS